MICKLHGFSSLLPNGYKFDASGLRVNGVKITNYLPVVSKVKKCVLGDKIETYIILSAVLDNGSKLPEINIPLRSLDYLNFQDDLDHQCYNYTKKSRSLICDLIRYFVAQMSAVEVYQAETLGFIHYNGRVAFNAGNRLIGDLGVEVELRTKGYNFNPPADVTNEQLGVYVKSIIQLNPSVTAPIFAYFVLGILRDLYRQAGVPIRFCLFLFGAQQSLKTTLATYLCSFYDRDVDVEQHVHNLTASEARLHEILNIEKDSVAILDDLNLDDSRRKELEQERTISGLIRASANGVGKETVRDQKRINAQPLFCGEYLLKNGSTNSRLLILHLEQGQINKEKLYEIQKDANLLTAFAEQLIVWLLDNYQELCQFIQTQYNSFMQLRAGSIFYQERLNRSGAVMSIAYAVFLQFCKVKGWDVGLTAREFNDIIKNVLENQIEYLNLDGTDEPDHVIELYRLFRSEQYLGTVLDGRPKGLVWRSAIYYDEEKDRVYIKNDKMRQMLEDISKKFKREVSIHELLDALDREDILIKDKNKNRTRSRTEAKHRCFVLDFAKLEQYVEDVAEEFRDNWDNF